MNQKKTFGIFLLLLFCSVVSMAQVKKESTPAKFDIQQDSSNTNITKPQKSITQGTVTVEGKRINYQAVAGTLILKNKDEKPTCSMFYTAYFKTDESDASQRPVTFIYNGGPGSSTLWLHIGAWGPQLAFIKDTQRVMPPYKTVNNDYSLLDASDLVFIDAPGTGFSQLITKDKGGAGEPKDFYGADPDGEAFAQFITNFLSTYNRWNSPKYLFGESYGTFRSAVLSNILETKDAVDLNGVILLSQILDYNNANDMSEMNPGNDRAYELALPTAAATAWHFHKVPNQPAKLEPFLKEVEHFAMNDYALALNKGSLLDSVTSNQIAEKLHEYTGLSVAYILKSDLRVNVLKFQKMMLESENKILGNLDTRFAGPEMDPLAEYPEYDPHTATISSAFVGAFNTYVHTYLKYGKEMIFHTFGDVNPWDMRAGYMGSPYKFFPNVMPDLAAAMIYNPKLKVMLNMGYFDFGTPYFEGLFEMHHLPIPKALQDNISYAFYHSGHMVYLNPDAHKELHDNVAKFINSTH